MAQLKSGLQRHRRSPSPASSDHSQLVDHDHNYAAARVVGNAGAPSGVGSTPDRGGEAPHAQKASYMPTAVKSAKRRVAEALLAARYGGASGLALSTELQQQQQQRLMTGGSGAALYQQHCACGSCEGHRAAAGTSCSGFALGASSLGNKRQKLRTALPAGGCHQHQHQHQQPTLPPHAAQAGQQQHSPSALVVQLQQRQQQHHLHRLDASGPHGLQATAGLATAAAPLGAAAGAAPRGGGAPAAAPKRAAPPPVHVNVASCPPSCTAAAHGWCRFDVKVPSVNWQAVFDHPAAAVQRISLARGYEKLILPEGLTTYFVQTEKHAADAIAKLRASMQDRVIAIDLEWRPLPRFVSGPQTPVAVLQLASGTVCVVLHISAMNYRLPPAAATFLADPSLLVLGFGWDTADETKMMSTFKFGRARFGCFVDLQTVAQQLGYFGYGLARLAAQVLGTPLVKSKSVSMSNWAAPMLSPQQLKYAALDVFAAGQLFRGLRLWHSSPSPCPTCHQPIGAVVRFDEEEQQQQQQQQAGPTVVGAAPRPLLKCGAPGCKAVLDNFSNYLGHCRDTGHNARYAMCESCGRVHKR